MHGLSSVGISKALKLTPESPLNAIFSNVERGL